MLDLDLAAVPIIKYSLVRVFSSLSYLDYLLNILDLKLLELFSKEMLRKLSIYLSTLLSTKTLYILKSSVILSISRLVALNSKMLYLLSVIVALQ